MAHTALREHRGCDDGGNRGSDLGLGKTTINYKAALTGVETSAVDAGCSDVSSNVREKEH
jgi:hypothetical protein